MRILIVLSLVCTFYAAASAIEDASSAAELVEMELLTDGYEGKIVYSYPSLLNEGELLPTWHKDVIVPFNSYLIFIDDMALANWEHPCRWVFVSTSGEMDIIEMYTPPDVIQLMDVEFTGVPRIEQRSSKWREWLLTWFTPNPQPVLDPENNYAWLISGGKALAQNYPRYYGDIQFLYLTLTEDYAYLPGNIIVCISDGRDSLPDQADGENSDPDLNGDGIDDINHDATYSGIMSGYRDIAEMLGPDDNLFVFTTDHGSFGKGGKLPTEGILNLWNNEYLDDDIFKARLDQIPCNSIHVVMEQCFSGTFEVEVLRSTGSYYKTFASAANAFEVSWGGETGAYFNEWIYWWIGAQHGSAPPIGPYSGVLYSNPDLNFNGYVDFEEAYIFATQWDSRAQSGDEHPQYGENPTSCGNQFYLGGEIPPVILEEAEDNSTDLSIGSFFAYPVPSSSSISVSFNLEQCRTVDLGVYDLSGRCISILASEQMNSGSHVFVWESDSAPAGTYLVRLSTETQMQVIKILKVE